MSIGWVHFTSAVVHALNNRDHVVCVLMGRFAKILGLQIDRRHPIIETVHPMMWTPTSGAMCFTRVNNLLQEAGREPIDFTV